MGKRKIHGITYYQCDYTGLPMRTSYCYAPTWKEDGRMVKQGSYCCWEAVLDESFDMTRRQGITVITQRMTGPIYFPEDYGT